MPDDMISSGNSLLIRFRTDDSIHNKGFTLTYSSVDANEQEQFIIQQGFKRLENQLIEKYFHQPSPPPPSPQQQLSSSSTISSLHHHSINPHLNHRHRSHNNNQNRNTFQRRKKIHV